METTVTAAVPSMVHRTSTYGQDSSPEMPGNSARRLLLLPLPLLLFSAATSSSRLPNLRALLSAHRTQHILLSYDLHPPRTEATNHQAQEHPAFIRILLCAHRSRSRCVSAARPCTAPLMSRRNCEAPCSCIRPAFRVRLGAIRAAVHGHRAASSRLLQHLAGCRPGAADQCQRHGTPRLRQR